MKIARFEYQGAIALGLVDVESGTLRIIEAQAESGDPMIAVIERHLAGQVPRLTERWVSLAAVRLLAPITRPSKNVLCIGKNYAAHAAEFTQSGYDSSAKNAGDVIPDAPIVFTKAPGSLTGAREPVQVPWEITQQLDYEAELGVIIGRPGRGIARANALQHVWAYTCINDVTARDLQAKHKQWLLGKSIDTFCPIGPWLVTADELDPANLELKCWVNGELRQHANTRDLIFDIPTIIATISASMRLEAGDIIATGTPAGVGIGFKPPKFLKSGDTVRVAIAGIGELENKMV